MTTAQRERIAVLGTPSRPRVAWTQETLDRLRADGFTGVQLNIAWSYRPLDEPLSLEDLIAVDGAPESLADPATPASVRLERMGRRSELVRAAGLRSILHVGMPFQGRAGFEGAPLPQCLSDPGVVRRYRHAVEELARALPYLDDLLVYTYDQDAWLCSEFQGCPRCAGVPLPARLAPFLDGVARSWREARPGGRLWWEPWELTAGQALATVALLDPAPVGLMVHSNIGEVMTVAPADLFLRNLAALAARRGIPVIAEAFLSSSNEEVEPWRHLPVPSCTLEQVRALDAVPGVIGVKEYFGLSPSARDVNAEAAVLYFADPDLADDPLIARLARSWGYGWLSRFWTLTSSAYRLYPWDLSWFARQLGRSDPAHALSAATLRGTQTAASTWDTPAWRASRRGVFMRVTNEEPHPWQLEDARLRFRLAADAMREAVEFAGPLTPRDDGETAAHIRQQVDDATRFMIRCTAYECHIEETLLAERARTTPEPAARAALLDRLDAVLARDADNLRRESELTPTSGVAAATPLQLVERWVIEGTAGPEPLERARAELASDPELFLRTRFRRGEEEAAAGQFSLTTA